MSLLELFCHVNDFCRAFVPEWHQMQLASGAIRRNRARSLSLSAIMTILIWFHCSGYRNFKTYYQEQVCRYWQAEFPGLVSYTRFVEFMPSAFLPLCAYLRSCLGACTGISFLDSTPLAVCDNHRLQQHKVFDSVARRGKSSTGWFFGFNNVIKLSLCQYRIETQNSQKTPICRKKSCFNGKNWHWLVKI